ncbi:GNAT family N-acetyltransferase [Streptomyces sp. NBC_00322]|uniref:GNAT family N-acetyltransferase n=1 Tax=Streptomyces sp. NBC_00322 TaxID=2975712 RepID=UPI002E28BFAE|nr:GNAT family N-acetyltransferase [Streptomyces sp. NBC_00322]
MLEVFVRRLTRWQAEQQRESVADVYVETYRAFSGAEFHDRQEFLRRFAEDVQRPGFDMVVTGVARLAGCAYGFRLDREGGWWQGFRGELPHEVEELTASGQGFALAELMVVPAQRRRGVATALVRRLLERSDTALVTVLLEPTDVPARSAFQSWGWTRIGDIGAESGSGPVLGVWSRTRTE